MIWLLIAIFVMFVLFAIAFRRSLMFWMKSGDKDNNAAEMLSADVLTPEERQKLRDRYKQKLQSGR